VAFRAPDYERFEGTLSARPPWWPIWRATFRRGWHSKWIRMITIGSFFMAFGLTVFVYGVQSVAPGWIENLRQAGRQVGSGPDINFNGAFYLILLKLQVFPFMLPLAMLLGYDLISGDLRSNAFESYFSRSITPWGYVFGRTLAYAGYLLAVTLLPLLWIWLLDVMTAPEGHFQEVSGVPLGLAASMTLVALTLSLFIQALTTITRSGVWTGLLLAVLFFLSSAIAGILYENTRDPRMLALAFWENIHVVANGFLGFPGGVHGHPPFGLSFGLMLAVLFGSLFLLLARVRRSGTVG